MAESTLRYECMSPVDGWFKFDRNVVVLNSHCWITAATGARPESSEQTGSRLCEEAIELQGGIDTRTKTSKRKNEADIFSINS